MTTSKIDHTNGTVINLIQNDSYFEVGGWGDGQSNDDSYLDGVINEVEIKNKLDLRFVFENNEKTLYRDFCCHLTNEGMYILAVSIVDHFETIFKNKIINN